MTEPTEGPAQGPAGQATNVAGPGAPPPHNPPPEAARPGPPGNAEDRPPPRITSLAGTAAGLFLLTSLTLFLSEITGDMQRIGGILVGLAFEAVGVTLLVLDRDRRASTAGVTLTALGLIPLLVYLFVDVRNPGNTISDVNSFTSTATLILLAAAALWLVAYFFGPGRRYGFYLGAALLALWLVAVVQIVDEPISQLANSATSSFVPGPGDSEGFESSDDFDSSDDFGTFDPNDDFNSPSQTDPSDPFGPDGFDPGGSFDDETSPRYREPDDPFAKLGWASLIFGGVYLAGAAWRDRRHDQRQATVLAAVSIPILTLGVLFLAGTLETVGTSLLAIALGAVAAWIGTRGGRRFTSWYGTFAVVTGTVALVGDAVGDSARVSGLVLLVIGLAVALLVMRTGGPTPRGDGGPGQGAPPAAPAWAGTSGQQPATGTGTPAGAWSPPGAAPTTPWPSAPPQGQVAPSPDPWAAPGQPGQPEPRQPGQPGAWASDPSAPATPPAPSDPSSPGPRPETEPSERSPWDRPPEG